MMITMMSPFPLFSSILITIISPTTIGGVLFAAAAENADEKFTVANYPNPQAVDKPGLDHWRCHIDRPGLVCDPDALMTREERNALLAMSDNFIEATQLIEPNEQRLFSQCPTYLLTGSQFASTSMGIRLGIALVRHQLEQPEEPLYNRTKPSADHNNNYGYGYDTYSEQELRDNLPEEQGKLFDRAWARLRRLENKERVVENQPAAQLAKKWGLVKDAVHGCEGAMLILASAKPLEIHVYAHPAVPIFAEEIKGIVDNEMRTLTATGNLSSVALRSLIESMRELVVHRQRVLLRQMGEGQQQQQRQQIPLIPAKPTISPPDTVVPTTKKEISASPATVTIKEMAAVPETHQQQTIKIDYTVEHRFALFAFAFSMVAMCLAIFTLKKHHQMREELLLMKTSGSAVKMSALSAIYQQDEP